MSSAAFKRIMAGLEDALEHAKGNTPPGTRIHHVPVGNVDVAKLRAKLGLSQRDFARGFGVPLGTLQGWEQGRRKPRGPAHVLLTVIEKDPGHIIRLLWPQARTRSGGGTEAR